VGEVAALGLQLFDFVLLLFDDVFEVISFLLDQFESLLVLTADRFVLVDPLVVQLFEFVLDLRIFRSNFHLKGIHFAGEFKHIFFLFLDLIKKLLLGQGLFINLDSEQLQLLTGGRDFLLQLVNVVALGQQFLLKFGVRVLKR
jgi:hypothetical protein